MTITDRIRDQVAAIAPWDALESEHRRTALAWLESTDDVFRRVSSPPEPAMHLVSYFLPVDDQRGGVLLGEHRKSGLWLPPGGHVEPGEHPLDTVRRECVEELGVDAVLHPVVGDRPLMVTITRTRASRPDPHTDVSLWFVLALDPTQPITPDPREYRSIRWWSAEEITEHGAAAFDPHQARMLDKLGVRLHAVASNPAESDKSTAESDKSAMEPGHSALR